MPQIDDQELRQLFSAECDERLQKLGAAWLQLEQLGPNAALIEDMFREAHSLKGAARMLGLFEIQDLAHAMEEVLDLIRKRERTPSAPLVQSQLKALDQLRLAVDRAVREPAAKSEAALPSGAALALEAVDPVVARARGAVSAVEVAGDVDTVSAPADFAPLATDATLSPLAPLIPLIPLASLAPSSPAQADGRIDTLRVGADRLDFLLSQAGELVVCRNHLQRLHTELHELLTRASLSPDLGAPLHQHLQTLSAKLGEDTARLNGVTGEMAASIRTLRLLPAATLLEPFVRMVHDLPLDQGKQIDLRLLGGDTVVDKRIIEEMKAPLMHLLRNAIDHGLETPAQRHDAGKPAVGVLSVRVYPEGDHVGMEVRDDGRGLDLQAVRALVVNKGLYSASEAAQLDPGQLHKLILEQGFSTNTVVTDVSGRGVGLNVVRTSVERLRGSLAIDSIWGQGMRVTVSLPVSLLSTRVLLVSVAEQVFALPFEHVLLLRKLTHTDLLWVEGRPCTDVLGELVFLSPLARLLHLPAPGAEPAYCGFCIVLNDGETRIGVLVDALLSEQEVVIKPPPVPVPKNMLLLGVRILDSGLISPVLNVRGLSRQMRAQASQASASASAPTTPSTPPQARTAPNNKLILLAEDSMATRLQEQRILEAAGYSVLTAQDGDDAWALLSLHPFDALVSDIVMPGLSGLELTQKIRASPTRAKLPVVLISTLSSPEDRQRGMQAGADAYLAKPEFDQTVLLACLARLLQ